MLVELHLFPVILAVKSMLVFTKMHFDRFGMDSYPVALADVTKR
jgi:hypothetical protein